MPRKHITLLITTALLCIFHNLSPLKAQRVWRKIGDLQQARIIFGALPLSNRQILVMGGYTSGQVTATCELIDVESRSITQATPMNAPRAESAFLLTRDSNIVAISGLSTASGSVTPLCELYNRTTGQWTIVGRLLTARRQHVACFLTSEEILVVGGRDANITTLSSAEIFNLRTGQSRIVADFPSPINLGQCGISSQNKPLVFAGRTGGANSSRTANVYEYDIVNNRWLPVSNISKGLQAASSLKLADGRLLLSGGSRGEEPIDYSKDVYLENYPIFRFIAQMSIERSWHSMAQWNADTVMVLGGINSGNISVASTDWIDLKNNRVFTAPTMTDSHSRFTAIGLPLFNAQGLQTKAQIVAISGDRAAGGNSTPTVEILEEKLLRQTPPFPVITSALTETSDCNVFRLRLQAASGAIRTVQLGTSANVTLEVLTALPAISVEVSVRLQNPFVPPSLTSLRITDDEGQTEFVRVSALFPQRQSTTLRILSDIEHLFGDSAIALTCATMRIANTASTDALFPLMYLGQNIEFSVPLSQFPLRISAGGEASLQLCYTPTAESVQRDTLTLAQGCTVLYVPLMARGASTIYSGTSRCAVPIQLRTVLPASSETLIIVEKPFPQPTAADVTIPFQLRTSFAARAPITQLYNNVGQCVGRYETEEWNGSEDKDGRQQFHGLVRINTELLSAGVYRLMISAGTVFITLPIMVSR